MPGRFEVREPDGRGATVVLDGAHNPAGMKELVGLVQSEYPDVKRVAAISILHDKDSDAMLSLAAGAFEQLVITQCSNPRVEPADSLDSRAQALGIEHVVERDPQRALALARELAGPDGLAVATGSLVPVGGSRTHLGYR